MGAGDRTKRRASGKSGKLPLAEIEAILDNPDLEKLWPEQKIKQERKRVRGEKNRLFGRQPPRIAPFGGHVHGVCCSHRWAHDCWQENTTYPPRERDTPAMGEGGAAGKRTRGHGDTGTRGKDGRPNAQHSALSTQHSSGMRACPRCRAFVPAIYLGSSGHCLDCRLESLPQWRAALIQHSSSVIDYYQLRKERLKE